MSEGKKVDISQVQSFMQMMGKGERFKDLLPEGAVGAEGAVGGEGMMAAMAAAPEIVAGICIIFLVVFFAGGAYLNYWIADEYDKFVKVWVSDDTDGWGWYHFWHGLMDISFLIWFWELWFGPRAAAQTGGVSRYRCTNGRGEPCGNDTICLNLDRLGTTMDNLGLWLGWWDPSWDPQEYKCDSNSCYRGYHVEDGDLTKCVENACTCSGAVSNKGEYPWKTGDAVGEICLAHNGDGCMVNTCNADSFYSHRNCFTKMECKCPDSDFNGTPIENVDGKDKDCISTDTDGTGKISGPICLAVDGTTLHQSTQPTCVGEAGTWHEHKGCDSCVQPDTMTETERTACTAETSPSHTSCLTHGSNCTYIMDPDGTRKCNVSNSGNIFSKNKDTGICEVKLCKCESDTATYTEQRGIPNTGDDCTKNDLNSCQSCYDGFEDDPTNVQGPNQCQLPSTDQGEGSFCWGEQGILCTDEYYCGNPKNLNFELDGKGMCLPKHQGHNMRGADAADILEANCEISPTNNPYKPGYGSETSDDNVTPVYATLPLYLAAKGCNPIDRITLSRDGTTGNRWDDGNDYDDGANTCIDGRECASGICGTTTLGATLNCYQGDVGGIGSCCDPSFEADAGGKGSDSTLEYTHNYYDTSPGDHPGDRPQRLRKLHNTWWAQHGETINAAMSGA